MAAGIEAESKKGKVPFYRNPQLIGKAIDIITPDRTLGALQSFFHYEEEEGFDQHVLHYLKKDYWLVGVFSHLVLTDALALAKAANRLTTISQTLEDPEKHLTGCYAMHQGTMKDGSQGENVQTLTLKLEQAFKRKGMLYLPYISEEHVKRYNLDRDAVTVVNADYKRKVNSAREDKKALFIFPAGNMQGARKNEQGQFNGMVQSKLGWITEMAKYISRGAKILFVPGVIIDSFRISDPDKRDLTPEALKYFPRNLAASLLPFRLGQPLEVKLATLIMRRPYAMDRLAFDLMALTDDACVNMGNLCTLGYAMNSHKELTDQLIMGIIRDRMPDYLGGNHYKGYKSFGLGDYANYLW